MKTNLYLTLLFVGIALMVGDAGLLAARSGPVLVQTEMQGNGR